MKVYITTRERPTEWLPRGVVTKPEVKTIDWGNSSDQIWLRNHLTWAIHNNHMVTIMAESQS